MWYALHYIFSSVANNSKKSVDFHHLVPRTILNCSLQTRANIQGKSDKTRKYYSASCLNVKICYLSLSNIHSLITQHTWSLLGLQEINCNNLLCLNTNTLLCLEEPKKKTAHELVKNQSTIQYTLYPGHKHLLFLIFHLYYSFLSCTSLHLLKSWKNWSNLKLGNCVHKEHWSPKINFPLLT